jgi:hypothetical protein
LLRGRGLRRRRRLASKKTFFSLPKTIVFPSPAFPGKSGDFRLLGRFTLHRLPQRPMGRLDKDVRWQQLGFFVKPLMRARPSLSTPVFTLTMRTEGRVTRLGDFSPLGLLFT